MVKNQYICDCNIIHQDAVDQALAKMPSRSVLQEYSTVYKLLGDETRYKICFALDQHEMCVCDLANVLSMSKSSVSHQLKILREKHIIKSRPAGKEVYYVLDDDHIRQILQLGIKHVTHLKEENDQTSPRIA